MMNFPLRVTLHYSVFGDSDTTTKQHVMETLIPFVLVTAVACFITDVAIVVSFVGAIARTAVFLLYPPLALLKCTKLSAPVTNSERYLCYFLLTLWAVITVFGLIGCIRNVVKF